MADDRRWATIVIRAWADVDGLRARLLLADSGGEASDHVVASVDEITATVGAWLQALDDNDESGLADTPGPCGPIARPPSDPQPP